MNPYNSPWYKPTKPTVIIYDNKLKEKYKKINSHLQNKVAFIEYNGVLCVNKQFYLAKRTFKFRLISHLDWAWYTPKDLANAMDNNQVDSYYEHMLANVNSDPNIWNDKDKELELKSFYAARVNRASLL